MATVLDFLLTSFSSPGGHGFAGPGVAGGAVGAGSWLADRGYLRWARAARALEVCCNCYSGWCVLENLMLFPGKCRSLWNFYAEKKPGFAASCKKDGLTDGSVLHWSSFFSAFLKQISLVWKGPGRAGWHGLQDECFCWCLSSASWPRDVQHLEGSCAGQGVLFHAHDRVYNALYLCKIICQKTLYLE